MARKGGQPAAVRASGTSARTRVTVLLHHDSMSEIVMRAAAEVARRTQGDLLGLFVEDIELIHLAGMPFARELCFPSATLRDLDVGRMERSLRAAAGHARVRFEALAGSAPARSFRVTRGELLKTFLDAAAEADVVVTSAPARARSRHAKDRPVIVLSLKLQPQDVLAALGDLTRAQHFAVDVVLPGDAGGGEVAELREGMRLFRAGCLEDAEELLRGLMRGRPKAGG